MASGTLVYRPTHPKPGDAVVVYGRWRDSSRTQHTRRFGVVWAERHGAGWRSRRGQKPAGAISVTDALVMLRELVDAVEIELAARADAAAEPTFKIVAESWLAHGRDVSRWRPSTVVDRRSTLDHHLLPAFGDRPARGITRADVQAWWDGLHSTKPAKRKGGLLSDRTCNKLLTELRSIFGWAAEPYGLDSNPTDAIKKHKTATNDRPSFYTPAEIEALVRAAASNQDALAFKIAAYGGLRRGELVSLRWRHVNFTQSSLYVVESVSAGIDSTTKSGSGRTVPMAPQLAQALAAAQARDAKDGDLVLPGSLPGSKLDPSALRRRFIAARDGAGLPPLRFHDLRHTFGSLAVDAGASLVQVQAWMGHADLKTTTIYLHTTSRAADAETLGRAFTAESVDDLVAATSR